MAARGPAWFFLPQKDLNRLASKHVQFSDTSLLGPFTEGDAKPPWPADHARSCAAMVRDADVSDDRLKDNVEYRFFVGGVACKGVEAYLKLVATAAMCETYVTALKSGASEHGVAPWNSFLTECKARNGGLVKGPPSPIVGASRDETYTAAGEAVILLFECGVSDLKKDSCRQILKLCRAAGSKCPLDVKKLHTHLAACIVEESAAEARQLGAHSEDVNGLAQSLAKVTVWQKYIDADKHPQLLLESMEDVSAMMGAAEMHHGPALNAAILSEERAAADELQ